MAPDFAHEQPGTRGRDPIACFGHPDIGKSLGSFSLDRFEKAVIGTERWERLVDTQCLGVKNTIYEDTNDLPFRDKILGHYHNEFAMEETDPCCARKLVEQASAYAGSLGVDPHPDYKAAARVCAGLNAADCSRQFVFGRDGKPFHHQGPNESEDRARRIVDHLNRRLGEGNFDHVIVLHDSGFGDDA